MPLTRIPAGGVVTATTFTFNSLNVTATTVTASTITGALVISGGMAAGGNAYIGGNLTVLGTINATITGVASSATNIAGGTVGQVPYQTGIGATGFYGPGTAGQILLSNGASAPVYTNTASVYVGAATSAVNLFAGTAGQLHYQSAAGTSAFLSTGTTGQLLVSAAGAPVWTNTSSLYVQDANVSTNLRAGTAGQLHYQTGANASGFISTATTGNFLQANFAGAPTWTTTGSMYVAAATSAVNLFGGTAGQFAYQTGAGATAFASTGSMYVGRALLADSVTGSAGSLVNAVTFNNAGSGDASGTSYNGGAARTVSYNTLGAMPTTGGTFSGPVTFTQPVTFSGTATYVLSTNTWYTDNIIELHVPPGGVNTPWFADDGKDIGLRFHYYANSTDTNAALVLDATSKYLDWYSAGAESGVGDFSSATYGVFRSGSIKLVTGTQNQANTSTGDLTVLGGVGVGGSVFVGGTVTATTFVGALSFSHSAGTGLTGSAYNGSAAQTWSLNTATLMANAVTAINLAGGSAMALPYQSASGVTAYLAAGTAGQILQTNSTGSAPTWVAVTGLSAGTATTATQVNTQLVTTNATYYPTFVDSNNASATAELVYTTSSFTINPGTGLATHAVTNAGNTVELLRLSNPGAGASTQGQMTFYTASTLYGSISGGYGAAAPQMVFNLPSATTGNYIWQNNSVEQLRINTAGQVGVGSNYAGTSGALLSVNGGAYVNGIVTATTVIINSSNVDGNAISLPLDVGGAWVRIGNQLNGGAGQPNGVGIKLYNSGVAHFSIVSTGSNLVFANTGVNGNQLFPTSSGNLLTLTTNGGVAFGGLTNYGSSGQILQSNGNAAPTWVAPTGLTAGTATTATQVNTQLVTTNATYYPTFVDSNNASATAELVYTTSSFSINPATGNVGHGTASPAAALHVVGSESRFGGVASGYISVYNASTRSGYIQANGGTDLRIAADTDPMTFYVNGSERARIDTWGNVAIGKTGPYNTTTDVLTVLRLQNATSRIFVDNQNTNTSAAAAITLSAYGGDTQLSVPASWPTTGLNPFIITVNATERLRITSAGAIAFSGSTNYGTSGQVLQSNGNAAPTWVAVSGLSAGTATNADNLKTIQQTASASYYPSFVDSNNAAAAYEAHYTTSSFVINPATGNVGLGVASPSYTLDVGSAARFTSNSSSRALYLKQNAAGAGNIIQFVDQADAQVWEVVGRNTQFYIYNTFQGAYSLYINSATNAVTIAGTSSYSGEKFAVNGGAYVNGILTATTFVGAFTGASTQLNTQLTTGNATYYPTFVDSNNASSTAEIHYTTSSFTINPGTGAVSFVGTLTQSGGYAYLGSFNADPANAGRPVFGGSSMALSWNFSGGNAEMNLWNTVNPSTYASTGFRFLQQLTASTQRDLVFFRQDGAVGFGGVANVGTSGQVLQSNGSASPTWVNASTLASASATNADNLKTIQQTASGTYYPSFVDSNNSTAAYEAHYTTSSFSINPATGLTTIAAPIGGDGVPALRITQGTAPGTFNWISSYLNSSLTAGKNLISLIGQAESGNNSAYFGFKYVGAGSTSNFATIGMYGADNLVNILASGFVGIGNTAPAYKLSVNTAADVWHAQFGTSGGKQLRIGGSTTAGSVIGSYNDDSNSSPATLLLQRDGGSVGIGVSSTSGKLHVGGAGNSTGGNIHLGDNTDGSQKWTYMTGAHYNGATNVTGFALIGGLSQATVNAVVIGGNIYETNPATEIQFWTHTATTHALGGSQRMAITRNGGIAFGSSAANYGSSGQILQSNGDAAPTWVNASGITSGATSLTNTYVGFGNASNLLTGSSSLTWNGTTLYVNGRIQNPGYKTYNVTTVGQGNVNSTYEIMRIGRDSANWSTNIGYEVTARSAYFSGGGATKWYITYGYGDAGTISCMDARGGTKHRVYLGAEVTVTGNIKYIPVYIDIPNYYQVAIEVKYNTTEVTTFNSSGQVYFTGTMAVGTGSLYGGDTHLVPNGGNVGVGSTTVRAHLDVNDGTTNTAGDAVKQLLITAASVAPSSQTGLLAIQSNDALAADVGGSIAFGGRYVTADPRGAHWAFITGFKADATSGNLGGYLAFSTRNAASTVTERLRITQNGGFAFAGASNFGTSGQILKSNGDAAPTWVDQSTLAAGSGTDSTKVAKAGDTMTGNLTMSGAGVFLNRNASGTAGISYYSSGYTSWSTYMASATATSQGPTGNITAPTGAYVNSWALRNFVESASGYGFTWESGTATGQPSIVAELRSSDGLFHAYGNIYKYNSPSGGYMVPAISISDAAPSGTVNSGDLWWESDTGRLKIYYNDGSSSQWVDVVPVVNTSLFFSKSGGAISGPVSINGALDVTGNITATAEITAYYSDRRLKTDVLTIENALVKVKKLNGVTYRPNELAESYGLGTDSDVVGLFADEVEQVLPQAVKPAPFDIDENGNSKSGENYKTIQYEKVVPLLVEAIKEQQSIIEAQQAKIDRLMKHLGLED